MGGRTFHKALLKFCAIWLGMALFFALFGSLLDVGNLAKYHQIMASKTSVLGMVTGSDCADHDSLYYSFQVKGRPFSGQSQDDCELKNGQQISVYYSSLNPNLNTVEDPSSAYSNEIYTIMIGCLILPTVIIAAAWRPLMKKGAWLEST